MTSPQLEPSDKAFLDRAASLLDLVGRFADYDGCELMAIHALRAADLLEGAGATTSLLPLSPTPHDAKAAVRQALRLLAMLSPKVFDHDVVIEATEAAQQAFAAS